jgi:hypothetical protein
LEAVLPIRPTIVASIVTFCLAITIENVGARSLNTASNTLDFHAVLSDPPAPIKSHFAATTDSGEVSADATHPKVSSPVLEAMSAPVYFSAIVTNYQKVFAMRPVGAPKPYQYTSTILGTICTVRLGQYKMNFQSQTARWDPDPPNRLVLVVTDPSGFLQRREYHYQLVFWENNVSDEPLFYVSNITISNKTDQPLKEWRFTLYKEGTRISDPRHEGAFRANTIGGIWILASTEPNGPDISATMYFSISNPVDSGGYCGPPE